MPIVNDVHSQLNETAMRRVVMPRSAAEVRRAVVDVREEGGSLSIAGGRHAMGGQQFLDGGVLLDGGAGQDTGAGCGAGAGARGGVFTPIPESSSGQAPTPAFAGAGSSPLRPSRAERGMY